MSKKKNNTPAPMAMNQDKDGSPFDGGLGSGGGAGSSGGTGGSGGGGDDDGFKGRRVTTCSKRNLCVLKLY
jgi:hypothetical protein